MKCKYCNTELDLIQIYDDPDIGFAHNVYSCDECAIVLHNRVWDNKGNTWIKPDGSVYVESTVNLPQREKINE